MSYISPFDAEFHEIIWRDQWIPDLLTKEIPLTEDITPLLALTDESQVAKLVAEAYHQILGASKTGQLYKILCDGSVH